jgi:AbrB family looped-hinge helix DNA binding protein
MKITKMSTKGQIVIPEEIRGDTKPGTPFVITKEGEIIILKKVEGLTEEELKEIKELDKIWKEIDEGKGITQSKEKFLKELNLW